MGTERGGSRRPVIGIMTGSFHTDYSRRITDTICRHLKAEGMEPCLFQGLDASRFLNIDGYVDRSFDDHYYTQFEYSRFLRPDLIVASVSTISAVRNPLSARAFRAILPDVPVIALEIEDEIPNGVHVFFDNYTGMAECVEHLIAAHDCRKIYYVSGPRGVADAEKRLKAYFDTMRAHGLTVSEDMVLYGDFTDSVDPLIERILDICPRPDAIVCANDEMAESAYRVLNAHGLRPGIDVAVTGFDDNLAAAYMDPPLTTVRQSLERTAEAVMTLIRAWRRGEGLSSVMMPTELIVRQSCGCLRHAPQMEEKTAADSQNRVMEDRQTIKRLSYRSILTSLMLRNLLNQSVAVHSFFRNLGVMLNRLGAEYSWIALLDAPAIVTGKDRFRLPDRLRLHMLQRGDEVQSWSRADAPVLTPDEPALIEALRPEYARNAQMAVFPLFYGDTHYGVFAVRLTMKEMLSFYTLSLEMGTGLKYLFMALSEQATRAALEEKNQILDFSASHDGLTGLYNRIGVMKHIYAYIHDHGQNRPYVAVMADLDHLKQINDTFGHSMGDHAICKAAHILSHALPSEAPLGRSGGDEFMAVFRVECDDTAECFIQRVKAACAEYNAREEVPFFEEISVGCCTFVPQQGDDIRAFFMAADEKLYEDKRHRRACVLRGGLPV